MRQNVHCLLAWVKRKATIAKQPRVSRERETEGERKEFIHEENSLTIGVFLDLEVVADAPRRFRENNARWKVRCRRRSSRLVQDDELGSGRSGRSLPSLARSLARSSARIVLLVDDSRLRRYNCGLRSETRGNPRERRFLRLCAYRRVRACIRVSTLHRVCATSRGNPYLRAKGKREREREIEGRRATQKRSIPNAAQPPR